MIVDCAIYKDGHRTEGPDDLSDALDRARASGDAFIWIGLYEPTAEEFDLVTSEFGLHALAVEDALKAHQRPKLEVYEGSLFVVLKPLDYDDDADTVTSGELMVFVGDAFVVTVRHGEGSALAEVRRRLEEDPELLKHGPPAVLYVISDTVVDHYAEVAAELQVDLEELEERVFAPAGGGPGNPASAIYNFKRQVLEFRHATGPLMEPMSRLARGGLPFVADSGKPFFRDVADHLIRAHEQGESLDRLLSDILDSHLTQVGVRQNDDMRKISAWAAMAAAPTMIAGIYGMRFDNIPELHQSWSYPAVVAVMSGVDGFLYWFFKRRGWL
ncbi:magnesium and cobalt transport protein CorA [Streptomyces sp. H10-C2]|uniref:magnesium and cobalt transport protein CorA n=1 Tax=unclassified Streptomyces TaxID=2593676 RepID=UPI0024B90811|nr:MULTISPECIES: magnesium and cobalt transport protein CorA [unclassified Streptomyces]MDJ0344582.1 magnesium and cobalt transport protein CorA [Streptomyces sp. PH10-H1]MDJ0371009.1 magnesium and cobalt transport protein CorA [Streptomyces sp. H10-C2]